MSNKTLTLEEFCKTDRAQANADSWGQVENSKQACEGCGEAFLPTEDHPTLCPDCLSADVAELENHVKTFG